MINLPFKRKESASPASRTLKNALLKAGSGSLKKQAAQAYEEHVTGRDSVVLLLGDEGAVLVHMKKGKLAARAFSANPGAPETQAMLDLLKKIPHAPLYVAFDTMDQSYVQQTLPPVTMLSVNKMMKRRLDRDFSDDYIKGTFDLGRNPEDVKGWQFTMAALQQTSVVKNWLKVIAEWPNPCKGVLLLPVESGEILTRLQAGIRKHRGPALEQSTPDWQILVVYNKVSGIRQMVFNQGRLALTRLSQPALDASVETIAGTIEQEIISTREYMKRMTQQGNDILHIMLLCSEDICKHIDVAKLNVAQVEAVTPFQAAEMLHLEGAAQPTDRFDDSLLCAMLSTNRKRHLVLRVEAFRGPQMFTTALVAQRALGGALVLGLLGYIAGTLWGVYALGSDMRGLERQQQSKQQEMETLKKTSPYPLETLERIVTVMDTVDALEREAYAPDKLLRLISQHFADRIRVDELIWELQDKKSAPPKQAMPAGAKTGGVEAACELTLEFPNDIATDRQRLQDETTDILNQFKGTLPGFRIAYVWLPPLISDQEPIEVDLGQKSTDGKKPKPKETPQQTVAKLELIGPVDVNPAPANTGGAHGNQQK